MRVFIQVFLLLCLSFKVFSVETQTFGSWSLLCGEAGNCSVSQLVSKDPLAKQILMGVNVNFSVSNTFPVLMLRMPPNLNQTSGVGIKIDDNASIQVPISQCTPKACQSVIKIDSTLFEELNKGKLAKVAFALQKNQQLTLPVSLKGFSEAYKALLASR